jgi:hypothetical protein
LQALASVRVTSSASAYYLHLLSASAAAAQFFRTQTHAEFSLSIYLRHA